MSFESSPPLIDNMSLRTKVALAGAAALALFGLYKLEEIDKTHHETIQACVSDIVGEEVDLGRHPDTHEVMIPKDVLNEGNACLRAQGDADEARDILDR